MSARFEDPPKTVAAFLDWERRQADRHEFIGGEVRLMTGGTASHSRLVRNLGNRLNDTLGPRGCEAFADSLKVVAAGQVHYSDVVATCEPVPGDADVIGSPVLIAEVLSPSTAKLDTGRKWENYQTLPGLAAYLLVAQDRMRVELYTRHDGGWLYRALLRPEDRVEVPALGLSLPLAALYDRVIPTETAST